MVEKYLNNFPLNYDPFEVCNVHAKTRSNYSITIPSFNEFNDPRNITFYVYKFHDFFDGLIGTDLLDKWDAVIDYKNKTLITKTASNPIYVHDSRNANLYEEIIPAGQSKLLKIPINMHDGEAYIKEQKISNCIISECLTSVKNNRGIVEVKNPSRNDVIFSMDRAVFAEINNINFTCTEQSQRVKDVLTRLRTEHLNVEERKNLELLCSQYSDVFYLEGEPLTFTNRIKHSIKTTDEVPVHTKSYRYPYVHRQEVQEQIGKMLEQGIIRPSNSAWSSPIWVVPKKVDASGKRKWRIVVDFRKLNEKTIDDKYPIPNISDVLDKLGKCQYFTTLDLASGFYQVQTDPQDIHKTAFNVEHGHYEFLRMPMGLKNSPATFQRVMDDVLKGLQNSICLVYMDDIIVYSTSLQEHIVNLRKVFQRLRESNFKIQMDKSEFLKRETAFLGHIISADGVKPNPDKIAAIEKYPIPKTPKEIKQFLGLVGYYRKFIPDFATLTKPLTQCLKKGRKIILNDEYISSFEKCKTVLTNDPILQYPDFNKDFNLTTDASNVAIGAILSQGPIGADKPICYASRTLNDSEQNYSTIEKELLAIVWATKYFRPYLFGRKFKIITDHKPLQWMVNLKEPNSRLTRWRLRLSEFDYTVIYKKGKNNTNADALSRIEIHAKETKSLIEEIDELNSLLGNPSDTLRRMSNSSTISVPEKSNSSTITASHQSNSSTLTAHSSHENPILEIPITDEPLNKFHRQVIFTIVDGIKRKPAVSKPFEKHTRINIQLSKTNLEEDLINAVKEYICSKIKTAILVNPILDMYTIIPILQSKFKSSSMNLVLAKTEIENVKEYTRQQEIIRHYHEGKTNHRGINETYLSLSRIYFWPKMKDQITKFITECTICGQAKYDRNPVRPQFNIVPPATKPFEIIHIDLLTIQNIKYMTFIDVFTKYGQAYYLRDGTAVSVLQALLQYCTHHGVPMTIITDNGTEFANQLFNEFTRLHKINHHRTLAHSPNGNGNIEKFHSTLLEHLRLLKLQHKDEPIVNLMPYGLIAYNSSIHSFTRCRPFDLLNGHFDPRDFLDIDLTQQILQQYLQTHKERMKKVYDIVNQSSLSDRTTLIENRNNTREPEIEYAPDQQIFVRNPLAERQKTAPRYTQDTVLANLPIHIYTKKKRGPIAKSRLKRIPKAANLLQDPGVHDATPGTSSGH